MLRDSVEAQGAQGMNILEFHPLWQCRCVNTHHCHGSMDAQLMKQRERILCSIKEIITIPRLDKIKNYSQTTCDFTTKLGRYMQDFSVQCLKADLLLCKD